MVTGTLLAAIGAASKAHRYVPPTMYVGWDMYESMQKQFNNMDENSLLDYVISGNTSARKYFKEIDWPNIDKDVAKYAKENGVTMADARREVRKQVRSDRLSNVQGKYIQGSTTVHANMADNARIAGRVYGKREGVKSSKNKYPTNLTPAKKKRKK